MKRPSTKRRKKRDLYLTGVRTSRHWRREWIRCGVGRVKKRPAAREHGYSAQWIEDGFAIIRLPKVISIYNESWRQDLIRCIEEVHELAQAGEGVVLDFSSVERIFASGMLLFYAEVRNAWNIHGFKIGIHCPNISRGAFRSKRDRIRQVLKQIGFYTFVGAKIDMTTNRRDVVDWRFVCGTKTDGDLFADLNWEDNLHDEWVEGLYEGIMEAAGNCLDHAYSYRQRDFSAVDNTREGWWVFSQIKNNVLTVVFCDLGIGIPTSLPYGKYRTRFEALKNLKAIWSDSEIIAESTTFGVSSTKLGNRGRGLGRIIDLAKAHPDAKVTIFSNAGIFKARYNKEERLERDYSNSINGTIIQFNFPLA